MLLGSYPLDDEGGGERDEERERIHADQRHGAEHDAGDNTGDHVAERASDRGASPHFEQEPQAAQREHLHGELGVRVT